MGFRRDGDVLVDGFCDLLVVHLDLFTSSFFCFGTELCKSCKI